MTRPSGYLASPRAWISGRPSTAPDLLFDPSVARPARVYGYWLGGKDHYQADREAAEEVIRCCPQVVAGGGRTGRFWPGSCVTWRKCAAFGSSSSSDPGSPPPAPPTT